MEIDSKALLVSYHARRLDYLSQVLFIYYLTKCLKEEQTQMYGFYLCPKYADDITYVTTSLEKLEEIEKDTPPKLKSYNLQVNQSKSEKYQIPRPIPEQYLPECTTSVHLIVLNVLWSELDWIANMQTSGNKVRHQCRHKKT